MNNLSVALEFQNALQPNENGTTIKFHVPAGFKFDQLAPGNVLIVGSGQSGCQLADLMIQRVPDKKVYLSTSAVPGCPRSVQGRDLFAYLEQKKFLEMPRSALDAMPPEKAKAMKYAKVPVTGPYKELSPFCLACQGVTLVGTLDEIISGESEVTFTFKEDRATNLGVSKAGYEKFHDLILDHAGWNKSDVPSDPTWKVDSDLMTRSGPAKLNAAEHTITNILWCSGWSRDFAWLTKSLPAAVNDMDPRSGAPDVICSQHVPGLFYCGFP